MHSVALGWENCFGWSVSRLYTTREDNLNAPQEFDDSDTWSFILRLLSIVLNARVLDSGFCSHQNLPKNSMSQAQQKTVTPFCHLVMSSMQRPPLQSSKPKIKRTKVPIKSRSWFTNPCCRRRSTLYSLKSGIKDLRSNSVGIDNGKLAPVAVDNISNCLGCSPDRFHRARFKRLIHIQSRLASRLLFVAGRLFFLAYGLLCVASRFTLAASSHTRKTMGVSVGL